MPAVSNPSAMQSTIEYDAPLCECPLCGSSQIRKYDRDDEGRTVAACRSCALLFMNPQYTDQYLDAYYANYFHDGDQQQLTIGDPDDRSRRSLAKTDLFRFVAEHTQPGRFLSIGCADGIELLLAERFGWQPEGYDVDDGYMNALRRQLNYPIYSGDFFKLNLPDNHYDCVFMDQVLEHPKNPRDYLHEAHRILKPGGVLYLGCPNIKSVSSRLKTALGKLRLKRRRGRHYDMFHHLFFYEPTALRRVLETYYGYQVVAVLGDPMCGRKTDEIDSGWLTSVSYELKKRFPILESSFRLLARKAVNSNVACDSSRAAA